MSMPKPLFQVNYMLHGTFFAVISTTLCSSLQTPCDSAFLEREPVREGRLLPAWKCIFIGGS